MGLLLLFLFFFLLLLLLVLFGRFGFGFFLVLGGGFGDLTHDHDEVSLLDAEFLDGVVVVDCLALEDDFEGIGWHALGLLDFVFEGEDLARTGSTLSAG